MQPIDESGPQSSAVNLDSPHIPCLDGIRAIAFLLVYVAHAGLGNFVPGGLGVTIFFFLSGYLITTLLRVEQQRTGRISLRNFYIRRAFRILPPMYITLAFAILLAGVGALRSAGGVSGITAAILYVCNYFGLIRGGDFNLPSGMEVIWSLAVEEHFYLIFPLLYLSFIKRALAAAAQARLLVTICFFTLIWRTILVYIVKIDLDVAHPWTYIATDCRFDSIAWGCLLAVRHNPWLRDASPVLAKRKGLFAIAGLAVLLLSLLPRDEDYRQSLRYTLQGIALYPVFYFCVSSPQNTYVRWLDWKILRQTGWISYSLYLVHFTVLAALRMRFQSPLIVGVISLAITILYAWLMRDLVETPLRRLRGRLSRPEPRNGGSKMPDRQASSGDV